MKHNKPLSRHKPITKTEKYTNDDEKDNKKDNSDLDDKKKEECLYNFSKIGKKKSDDYDDIIDKYFEDDDKLEYDTSNRITKPFLTKYERVRILGERAKQLSLGAKPMVKDVNNLDPVTIAKLELELKVLPIIIIRQLPSGIKEKWHINELSY